MRTRDVSETHRRALLLRKLRFAGRILKRTLETTTGATRQAHLSFALNGSAFERLYECLYALVRPAKQRYIVKEWSVFNAAIELIKWIEKIRFALKTQPDMFESGRELANAGTVLLQYLRELLDTLDWLEE
ncbi:MAG: hypothetical protein NZZ41_03365 [Candidatus Dojkabacteria bacterium]|nr:hypothetical protein [Candidatus Dojkabacteria bacterium]